MSDLEKLLRRLTDHGVEFVIVGGYAAVVHGATIVTIDVDVCCRFTTANLLKLQSAVADLHPVHRLTPQHLPLKLTARKCRGLKNLYLATDLGVIDCLGEVLGIGDYTAVKAQSIEMNFKFGRCLVLSLEGLIHAKQATGRPRDIEALKHLNAIQARSRKK